jgi:hypothetical protein
MAVSLWLQEPFSRFFWLGEISLLDPSLIDKPGGSREHGRKHHGMDGSAVPCMEPIDDRLVNEP